MFYTGATNTTHAVLSSVACLYLFQMHKELYRFVNETPQKTPTKGTSGSPRNIRFVRSESIGEEAEQPADDQAAMVRYTYYIHTVG